MIFTEHFITFDMQNYKRLLIFTEHYDFVTLDMQDNKRLFRCRMLFRLLPDKHRFTSTEEVYLTYQVETCNNNMEVISKTQFSRLLLSIYPEVSVKNKRADTNFFTIYQGLAIVHTGTLDERSKLNTDFEFSIESVHPKLPDNYFIKDCDTDVMGICSLSPYTCNGLPIIKELRCTNSSWNLTIGGKNVNLAALNIDDKFQKNVYSLLLVCSIVDKIEICRGRRMTNPVGRVFVTEDWSETGNENAYERRTRAKDCHRVLAFSSRMEACRACQKIQEKKSITKCTDEKCDTENSEDQSNEIKLTPQDSTDVSDLIEKCTSMATDQFKELLLSQMRNMKSSDPRGRRWSPGIIRLCLTMWAGSPKTYQKMKTSGFLTLPSGRLLAYYKNCLEQKSGLQEEVFEWMFNEAERNNLSPEERTGGIVFDEMSIQDNLHIVKEGKNMKLVGFTDMGNECEDIGILKSGKKEKTVANHVLQMTFVSFSGFRFPFAHFPTKGASQSELYIHFWEAVKQLSTYGFRCVYTNMDGAAQNRAFLKMNFLSCDAITSKMVAKVDSNPDEYVIFIMDYSHVIKKIRNNILKSGHATGCTRCLRLPDQTEVIWPHWVDAYKHDQRNLVKVHKKLTSDHIYLNSASKMRNNLAEEVLDSDMLRLMCDLKASKDNGNYLDGTIELLRHTSSLVKIFRDLRPIKCITDPRLNELSEVLEWFVKWEKHIKSCSELREKEKRACLMSSESSFDLQSCIIGFIQLVDLHLQETSKVPIIPGELNSDIIENNFCQQRALYNGANANPDYYQYAKTQNAIVLGQSLLSNKSNTGGREPAHPFNFTTPKPLNVRPKKAK